MLKFNTSYVHKNYTYRPTENKLPSMTQQNFKDDVDINTLFRRFVKEQGYDPILQGPEYEFDLRNPVYDVSDIKGLEGMFARADEANSVFMMLPAEVRERFDNDPSKLRSAIESFKDPNDLLRYGIKLKGADVNETQVVPQKESPNVQADSKTDTQA